MRKPEPFSSGLEPFTQRLRTADKRAPQKPFKRALQILDLMGVAAALPQSLQYAAMQAIPPYVSRGHGKGQQRFVRGTNPRAARSRYTPAECRARGCR